MALVAPLSRYKKNTYIIWIVVLVGFATYCIYDAKYNETFKAKHTEDGKPDSVLVFNQKAPPYLFGAAILLGVYLFIINHKKIVADDKALVIDNSRITIPYDKIEKIDKTHFDSKGKFTITYKTADGTEHDIEISDRIYDNLEEILNHVISKIS